MHAQMDDSLAKKLIDGCPTAHAKFIELVSAERISGNGPRYCFARLDANLTPEDLKFLDDGRVTA
jgi:hypothetical protein